ncbi:hypothetical protein [Cellulomonas alba]|uniref:Ig-like domain-containing protein n=1 Tax=Cellulomonas alba TaxID=3053467 RepID=A0ABT7SCX0_9CELL|nr:hypothetical protein [Cellulomonas alba]MDM7854034.1 hypothetical protein [Cellulomonas alba]
MSDDIDWRSAYDFLLTQYELTLRAVAGSLEEVEQQLVAARSPRLIDVAVRWVNENKIEIVARASGPETEYAFEITDEDGGARRRGWGIANSMQVPASPGKTILCRVRARAVGTWTDVELTVPFHFEGEQD